MDAEPSFLEGVGDEVLIGLVSTLGIIALVSIVYNRRGGRRTVHPLQEEIVQITRNRLGFTTGSQEQNNEPAADGAANETPALPTAPPVTYSDDRNCPVCLNEARYLTMTNCGHVFCAQCIITYWRFGRWLGAVRCPVCRQQVTILFANFSAEEALTDEGRQNRANINEYNKRYSGVPRPFMDYIYDLPTLLRQLWNELFSVGGLVWVLRMRILLCFLAAILYFASPLDIIPESVFGVLGLVDDVLIILLIMVYATEIYRGMMVNRAQQEAM